MVPPLIPPVTQILLKISRASIEQYWSLTYSCINETAVSSSDSLWTPFAISMSSLTPKQLSCQAAAYIRAIAIVYWGNIPWTHRWHIALIVKIWSVLTMVATAWVIWMYACASYWPWQMKKWVELWVYENHWRSINFIFKVLSGTASNLNFMDAGSPWYSKMNRWTICN